MLQRNGTVAPGALARRNGRTAYEHATLSLLIADGVGEVAEGSLVSRALTATVGGRLDLLRRRIEARAEVASRPSGEGTHRPAFSFDLSGPWDGMNIGPAVPARPVENASVQFRRPGADLPLGIRAYAPASAP
jgi:AsmA protein